MALLVQVQRDMTLFWTPTSSVPTWDRQGVRRSTLPLPHWVK